MEQNTIIFLIIGVLSLTGASIIAMNGGFGMDGNSSKDLNKTTGAPVSNQTQTKTVLTKTRTDSLSSSPVPSDSETTTQTDTVTRTATNRERTEEDSHKVADRRTLYMSYMKKFNQTLYNHNVSVVNYSVAPKNESATIYWTEIPEKRNDHIKNRQKATILYADSAKVIRESENTSVTQVPKRLYFSIHSPEGELYMLTYIDYLTAFKYSEGTMSVFDYQAEYEKNAEYGPAHPEYDENQTATAASA